MHSNLPMPPPGFDDLPLEEKLAYVQALWERIAAQPGDLPVPEWQRRLVRERLAAHQRGEGTTVPWSTVHREAEDLFRDPSEEAARRSADEKRLDAIYDVLETRFESGEIDVAAPAR
jgi:putative addiction module component (TIGR02574 family)